ncbi:S24 family peptidase [Clostridium sp.]|jgi:SOS regulatory protein LexA|uniref:LexA family protein n=1 Tax=Clostridium sp. TaxID=1506 RepID=UPI003EEF7671
MDLCLEQQKLIHSKPSKYSLIRGMRNSGKTTAAIYRSLYLKNHYCLYEDDKILMLTSQDEDIDYIKKLYAIAEDETKLEYLSLFSSSERNFHVVTLESILHRYFLEYQNKYKLKYELISDKHKKRRIMEGCILQIKDIYPKLKILRTDYVEFFIEEVKWIKSCNYLGIDLYSDVNRVGRKCPKGQGPQRISKNSTARKSIYEVMVMYNEKLKSLNLVDNEDINMYALEMAKIINIDKYCHIISHKSNNLTKIQIDFIKTLSNEKPYSSIMFLLDMDNPHKSNSWMVKGKRVNTKPLGEKAKSYTFKSKYNAQVVDSFENFQFCDIRHGRAYDFMRDYSRISDILVTDGKEGYEYLNEELLELPVYSDIAAGEPILINSEVEGNFYIPKYWLKGVKNSFILKVKGDSMIEANINHGDYVIIRHENAANNNDIVAVDIGGNATLKRLSIKKDKILLMPANEKYHPIVIDSEDTYIIGTAIAIIKHKN